MLKQMQETQEMRIQSLVWGDPLEEGRETHSGILAWRMDSEHWQAIVCGVAKSQTRLSTHPQWLVWPCRGLDEHLLDDM